MMKALFFVAVMAMAGSAAAQSATASHILVAKEEQAKDLMAQIKDGSLKFDKAAEQHSTCPSGKQGGSLGNFQQGQMVPEFDKVIFDPATKMNEVYGPVKTQFGYHLIIVYKRSGVNGEESA